MSFGYNSGICFKRSVSTIEDFARELLHWISIKRERDPNRPLIFICHSLGGIVVKKVIEKIIIQRYIYNTAHHRHI